MSVGETYVTVQGRVGSDVEYKDATATKVALASFRLGSTPRYYDRGEGGWMDRPTTWFTVECWRSLAENVKSSLERGQPVMVTGRLKTTEWVDDQGVRQSRTVLDAFSVGHDLTRGTAVYRRNAPAQQSQASSSLDEEMRRLSDTVETAGLNEASPFHPAEQVGDGAVGAVPVGVAGRTDPVAEEVSAGRAKRAA
ncbi:MAG TPA: single-stranded DNA-binding protein [Kribbella sp.]|nr:single-stranded DNA-binding protein [Kribbella sp.]